MPHTSSITNAVDYVNHSFYYTTSPKNWRRLIYKAKILVIFQYYINIVERYVYNIFGQKKEALVETRAVTKTNCLWENWLLKLTLTIYKRDAQFIFNNECSELCKS